MTPELKAGGRVALVTGGASGLGRAAAEALGKAGFRVALADVDEDAGTATAAELRLGGLEVQFVRADVSTSVGARAAVEAPLHAWNRVDFVLNNAGIVGAAARIDELEEQNLERVIAVNLKGPFLVCRHAVPALRAAGGGSIVNVASITAMTGSAYYSAYSASKAGVIALTRSLARNLGRHNIRVNCIAPGSIAGTKLMSSAPGPKPTEEERRRQAFGLMKQIPLGHPARAAQVAGMVLFLASEWASHVNGAVLTVDGGERLGFH